ncbi:MAG: RNA-binding protein [Verrucomicrobia bacterium]|nr:RNA-binding protein [Verrucomicrobiota bacterium]
MRSDSQQTGRRRRGGRRHTSRGPRDSASSTSRVPAKKPGFFQRLIAFFTGAKPAAKSPARAAAPASNGRNRITVESQPRTQSEPRAARKPELVEVTSPKVYVGNLSFDAVESDLFELFAGVGSVQNAEIVSHRETQKSKGFAFVTLASVEEAKRAVVELHDKEFMGRRLVISGAKTSDVRDSR